MIQVICIVIWFQIFLSNNLFIIQILHSDSKQMYKRRKNIKEKNKLQGKRNWKREMIQGNEMIKDSFSEKREKEIGSSNSSCYSIAQSAGAVEYTDYTSAEG